MLFSLVFCCFLVEAKNLKSIKKVKAIDFDIPAQRADLSLISFAEQANMTLLFPFDKMKDKQANKLIGKHSIKEGLNVLLKNTGLEVKSRRNGQLSITINSNLEEDNMNIPKKTLIATLLASFFAPTAVMAAEADESADEGEKVVIIGSRSRAPRTIADSPVPVDILSADDLNAMGGTADLTDNLKMMVPSYTATPATGDGSAFVRPTSLRGTAPDQTLVLVDGKRRHRSALVQFFAPAAGNGAHGVDIGMIPSIALKRVEVLRDGAASQYGSDAIAGVINFVTKDASDGGEFNVQYGQHYEGEQSIKFGINKGLALGENGYLNLSLEYADNDALSRGVIRQDAQDLLDDGVTGVGADSPFGDAPFTQTWGRPETDATRFFANAGIEIGDNKLYSRLSYASTFGRYRFFYRNTSHSTLNAPLLNGDGTPNVNAGVVTLGYTGQVRDVGFTPYLDGDQTDLSFIVGFEGTFSGGTYFDFSMSTGENELDYFLNNTINPGLGVTADLQIPQMDFDVGAYKQEEFNLNADFSTPIGDSMNLAYGAEFREETYTIIAGEEASYRNAGSSGFAGIKPQDAGAFDRDNMAVYLDLEHDISSNVFLQYALRYEDFSDFGSTVNGKIATRINVSDSTALRGAVSTGFHAPTPGQSNVSTTITTFDGTTGAQQEERLLPPTSTIALANGGKQIKEEESTSISFGVTSDIGESTTLTVDLYQISVDDRIYRTGDITLDPATPIEPGTIRPDSISFYTNAIDVKHSGLDIVLTSDLEWSDMTSTNLSFAYSYNKIDVTGQRLVNGVNPVSDNTVEDIENNYPNSRFSLTANTSFGDDLSLMVRANYYGAHYDERGTISGTVQGDGTIAGGSRSSEIDPVVFIDAEVAYTLSDSLKLRLGFANIFDTYIDEVPAGTELANRQSVGLQYPRRSAANYEGGSWYLGANYTF